MVEGRQLPMFMTKQLGDNLKISKVVSKKKKNGNRLGYTYVNRVNVSIILVILIVIDLHLYCMTSLSLALKEKTFSYTSLK